MFGRPGVIRRAGRIGVEQPIHISNVLPVNPKTSKGTRVRYPRAADGGKKRVAVDGTELGTVKKAKRVDGRVLSRSVAT